MILCNPLLELMNNHQELAAQFEKYPLRQVWPPVSAIETR
jgi:hypothetical protein